VIRRRPASPSFVGFRFPPDVVLLAVRWYLRYGLSYRDVEELLAERGVDVDHVTIYRWVQRFTPLVIDAARPCRRSVGDRWFVDETYVRVAGVWRYVYRAVDQYGQVIDVLVSKRRNVAGSTRFFETMLVGRDRPREVTTDLAAPLLRVVDNLLPEVLHDTTRYGNNRIECDHGRLKARLRPMRGLLTDRTASTVIRGARLHSEPAARPLRTRRRSPSRASTCRGGVRRTDRNDLTRQPSCHRLAAPFDRSTQQCRSGR
jgi:IS6 family transposase